MFYFYCLLLCSPFYAITAARSCSQDVHSFRVANIALKQRYNEKIYVQERCDTHDYQAKHAEWPQDSASPQLFGHSLEARADREPEGMPQPLTTNQLVARNREISDLASRFKHSRNGKALIEIVTRLVTTKSVRLKNSVVIGLGPVGQMKSSKEQLAAFEVLFDVINKEYWLGNNQVYFADPVFNAVDKAILRSRGYQVLENPNNAQHYISVNSFVFAPFAPINIELARTTIDPPSLFLGTSPQKWLDLIHLTRNLKETVSIELGIQRLRLLEFIRGCEHHDLFLEPGGFKGLQPNMALLWKMHARPKPKDRTDMLIDRILESWTQDRQLMITQEEEDALIGKLKAAGIEPFGWE